MKVVDSECNKRSHNVKGSKVVKEKKKLRCRKYFRTFVDKGKDMKTVFEKLKRDENKQNGELSKRLDLLEEKTESELHPHPLVFDFDIFEGFLFCYFLSINTILEFLMARKQ